MSDRYVRNDDPDGEVGGHGSRWMLAEPRLRGDALEVYALRYAKDPGVRISVKDFRSGTNTPSHGCVCMDSDSAIEFANEIIRLANSVRSNLSSDQKKDE